MKRENPEILKSGREKFELNPNLMWSVVISVAFVAEIFELSPVLPVAPPRFIFIGSLMIGEVRIFSIGRSISP